jgi:murein DD-endopeptidase MepM/ murein hydrolase activator NlpD
MRKFILTLLLGLALWACTPTPDEDPQHVLVQPWVGWIPAGEIVGSSNSAVQVGLMTPSASPVATQPLYGTPTPDAFRETPALREDEVTHIVQWGDSLNSIAARYQISPFTITQANGLVNANLLQAGQYLRIPPPEPRPPGPSFKIIPDSELINGPAAIDFDIYGEVTSHAGYLLFYSEEVEGKSRSGAAIVDLVARRYSINPRLLLAILDYQSSWLRNPAPRPEKLVYPMGYSAYGWEGLFSQLSWAADQLNQGYYRWRAGWTGPYLLPDGQVINPGQGLNAGTVGVQQMFAALYAGDRWREIVSEEGFYLFFTDLYGSPFARRVEPQLPDNLQQPTLQLPFEEEKSWSFTGGPHSVWGDWAAWAAIDFAPPGFAYGCVPSNEWVVAVADGVVIRSEDGEVLLDLDGDGFEQTGWVLLYMHIEARGRVDVGTLVAGGDRIGHPSCEGGVTTGTHLHFARKYNGEWISADGSIPFMLDAWVASSATYPYDGYLTKDAQQVEACACRNEFNQISR